jgi:putative oxidoreductase
MVGLGFFEHGYAKLARGPDDFIAILHAIGMPFAELLGWPPSWLRSLAAC